MTSAPTAPARRLSAPQARMFRRALLGVLLVGLLVFPLLAHPFFVLQIGAQTFVFGTVALSLIFLAAYGGMISLGQIALYGLSSYTVAILSIRHEVPWPLTVLLAVLVAAVVGLIFGLVAVRTRGIYLLMITLALAMLVFLFTRQNDTIFGGWVGFTGVQAPVVGGVWLRSATVFYYLCLGVALFSYAAVRYVARAPFGLSLQGIRDNERRMRALGYRVELHRVAAFVFAGALAGLGGVIGVWYQGAVSPASIDLARNIMILMMAVVGGIAYPAGAFVGALVFILLDNFTTTYLDRERFNTYIGLVFVVILLVAPNGLLGIGDQLRQAFARRRHERDPTDGDQAMASPERSGAQATPDKVQGEGITADRRG